MKIEKVNDHQIRCTLTKADLADRELKISELAYGTEKAKSLFRDMMQQASFECGFEADNIPLMIEAIPLNSECIVLIITKVEDPEELDTRFSKFAPSVHDGEDDDSADDADSYSAGADDVLDLFKRIREGKSSEISDKASEEVSSLSALADDETDISTLVDTDLTRVFSFPHLNELLRLSHILRDYYNGSNSLYHNQNTKTYALVLSKSSHTPEEFNKICNVISEYGRLEKSSLAAAAYLNEHCELFIEENALQTLSEI